VCVVMSADSVFGHTHRPRVLLDVVDEEWARDRLPVDDVPVPAHVTPPSLDEDGVEEDVEAERDGQGKARTVGGKKVSRWDDLGLSRFR